MLSDGRVITVGDVAEIYNPDTGAWAVAGAVGQEARVHAYGSTWVWLADDSLLIIGGGRATDDQRAVATVWRFDPETNTTVEVAPLPGARIDSAAVPRLLDGRVLVVGGMERWRLGSGHLASPMATAFLYDPALDRWTETAPMPFADSPGQAILLSDGSVLVAGGSVPNPDAEVMTDVSSSNPVGWTARFVPGTATGD